MVQLFVSCIASRPIFKRCGFLIVHAYSAINLEGIYIGMMFGCGMVDSQTARFSSKELYVIVVVDEGIVGRKLSHSLRTTYLHLYFLIYKLQVMLGLFMQYNTQIKPLILSGLTSMLVNLLGEGYIS